MATYTNIANITSSLHLLLLYTPHPLIHEDPRNITITDLIHLVDSAENAKILFPFTTYYKLLQSAINTKKPNFDFIFKCFHGLQKNLLGVKNTTNQQKSEFNLALQKENSTTFINEIAINPSQTQEDVLDSEIFDLIFKGITRFLNNVNMVFDRQQLTKIIYLYRVAKTNNVTLSMTTLSLFIHTLYHHRNILSEKEYEPIYDYVNEVLKRSYLNDSIEMSIYVYTLELLLSLISSSKNINLLVVKEIYLALKSKIKQQEYVKKIDGILLKILCNVPIFFPDDFIWIFNEINSSVSPSDAQRILHHLFETISNVQQPNFLDFCKNNITSITNNKSTFNRFIRLFYDNDMTINHLTDEKHEITQEYLANVALQQLKTTLLNEWQEKCSGHLKTMAYSALHFLNLLDSSLSDETYLPSEKCALLRDVFSEIEGFVILKERSKINNIKTNRFYIAFCEVLASTMPKIEALQTIRVACQKVIEEEEVQRDAHRKDKPLTIDEAWIMLKNGDLHDLKKINTHLIKDKTNIECYVIKIRCLIKLGYIDEASYLLEEAKITFPGKHTVSLLKSWAACCNALGQYTVALRAYEDSLDLETKKINKEQTYHNIAYTHTLIGKEYNLNQAVVIYNKLLNNTPEVRRHKIILNLVRCLIKQNNFSDAEKYIKTIPDWDINPEALSALGLLEYKKHHYSEAITWYEKALENKGSLPMRSINTLLACYERMPKNNEKYQESKHTFIESIFERNIEVTQENLLLKVSFYMKRSQYEKSIETISLIIKKWGNNQYTYIELARCYRLLNQTAKALEILLTFPNYRDNKKVLLELAMTYGMAKMKEDALEEFDYLITEFPSYAHGYLKAIAYCIKSDDITRVVRYWKQFQETCAESNAILASIQALIKRHYPAFTIEELIDLERDAATQAENKEELDELLLLNDENNYSEQLKLDEKINELFYPDMLDTRARDDLGSKYSPHYAKLTVDDDTLSYTIKALDLAKYGLFNSEFRKRAKESRIERLPERDTKSVLLIGDVETNSISPT